MSVEHQEKELDEAKPSVESVASFGECGEVAEGETGADVSSDSAEEQAHEAEDPDLAENNALALVFEDVRRQSSDSELVTPSRWEELGLVPGHMTPEDFEMFVYEYLEDWRAEHEPEEETADALATTSATSASAGEGGASVSHARSKYASRAVGVPTLFAKKNEAKDAESAEGAETGARADEEHADASETMGASAAAEAPVSAEAASTSASPEPSAAASALMDASASAAASASASGADGASPDRATDNPYPGLNIPAGYELREIEGEWVLVQVDPNPPTPRLEVNPAHIKTLVGAHSYYLYDSQAMTDTYANWAFLAAEDNPLVTFAFCVREDSRVYPRPMPAQSLRNAPFRMSDEDIERTWQLSREHADYDDIVRIEASNGDVYFYSTRYLSAARAEALAEWDAVERIRNV